MTDIEPITDLAQVQWSAVDYYRDNDWHVLGEVSGQPGQPFDLHVTYAHDGDGGDCSAWLADMVARKLSETDQTIRWQRDRAVDEVNRLRRRIKAVEAAAGEVLALSRDRNVCSPGPAYEVAHGGLAKAMDGRPAMREERS